MDGILWAGAAVASALHGWKTLAYALAWRRTGRGLYGGIALAAAAVAALALLAVAGEVRFAAVLWLALIVAWQLLARQRQRGYLMEYHAPNDILWLRRPFRANQPPSRLNQQ